MYSLSFSRLSQLKLSLFIGTGLLLGLLSSVTLAATPSSSDASQGLKEVLQRAAEFAVTELGQDNGFLNTPEVRIPLPANLEKLAKMGRLIGLDKQADELINTMNHAAESAVGEARPVLLDSLRSMSTKDAYSILSGPDDAATQYFRQKTGQTLLEKFRPIVHAATARLALADRYQAFASKASRFGLIKEDEANLDDYVTNKTLDGLFLIMATQEKQLRNDPIGSGSQLLQKVLGNLKP